LTTPHPGARPIVQTPKEELVELRRRAAELQAEAVDTIVGGGEVSELAEAVSELQQDWASMGAESGESPNDEVAQGGYLEAARRDLELGGEGQLNRLLGGQLLPGAKGPARLRGRRGRCRRWPEVQPLAAASGQHSLRNGRVG
jgi:hypothetical protein